MTTVSLDKRTKLSPVDEIPRLTVVAVVIAVGILMVKVAGDPSLTAEFPSEIETAGKLAPLITLNLYISFGVIDIVRV